MGLGDGRRASGRPAVVDIQVCDGEHCHRCEIWRAERTARPQHRCRAA